MKDFYEIIPKGYSKATGMKYMTKHLGISEKHTLAIGDSTNDMTMVLAAGLGLAVENAMPELQAAADRVIVHHDHHALRYVAENLI